MTHHVEEDMRQQESNSVTQHTHNRDNLQAPPPTWLHCRDEVVLAGHQQS